MALDIMEALVSFLCPTNEAASSCREFISNHSSVLPPIGPLFYFLLFPLIFTILFVYILSDTVLFGGRLKWAKVLIGVSAFIFIIISGLYPVALVLSEFWYILIVILGVWWFIKGHKKESGGGGGGKAGGSMPGLAEMGNQVKSRIFRDITGQTKRLERLVDLKLKEMEGIQKSTKGDPSAWRAYSTTIASCWDIVKEYKEAISIGGVPVGGNLGGKVKKLERILDSIEKSAVAHHN